MQIQLHRIIFHNFWKHLPKANKISVHMTYYISMLLQYWLRTLKNQIVTISVDHPVVYGCPLGCRINSLVRKEEEKYRKDLVCKEASLLFMYLLKPWVMGCVTHTTPKSWHWELTYERPRCSKTLNWRTTGCLQALKTKHCFKSTSSKFKIV